MKTWQRGLAIGVGFGLAVAVTESWLMSARFMQMNLPPIWQPMVRNSATEVALCALLGLAVSPLLRWRFGGILVTVSVGSVWAALGLVSTPESDFLFMLVVGPPGMGKSALLREFQREADGHKVYDCSTLDFRVDELYDPEVFLERLMLPAFGLAPFWKQRSRTLRTLDGVSGGSCIKSGSLWITAPRMSVIVSPLNAFRPVRHSYRTEAKANTSVLLSTAVPFACSGDM